jgi:hypothetical protein
VEISNNLSRSFEFKIRGYILTLEMFKFGLEDIARIWKFYKVNSEKIPPILAWGFQCLPCCQCRF